MNQIFELTGIPVDVDDPVVVAALLQSAYMKSAADYAVGEIRREVEALAVKVEQFHQTAARIEASSVDRTVDIKAIGRSVAGIAHDLGKTPPYPGWRSNLGLVFMGSVAGGLVVLAVAKGLGWLH